MSTISIFKIGGNFGKGVDEMKQTRQATNEMINEYKSIIKNQTCIICGNKIDYKRYDVATYFKNKNFRRVFCSRKCSGQWIKNKFKTKKNNEKN